MTWRTHSRNEKQTPRFYVILLLMISCVPTANVNYLRLHLRLHLQLQWLVGFQHGVGWIQSSMCARAGSYNGRSMCTYRQGMPRDAKGSMCVCAAVGGCMLPLVDGGARMPPPVDRAHRKGTLLHSMHALRCNHPCISW